MIDAVLIGRAFIDAGDGDRTSSTATRITLRTMDALQGHKDLGLAKIEVALPVGTILPGIGEVVRSSSVRFMLASLWCVQCICLHAYVHASRFTNDFTGLCFYQGSVMKPQFQCNLL